MKYKKGISFLSGVIISFTFISLMFMFLAVFIHQAGDEYLIQTTANTGIDILNSTATSLDSTQGIDTINETRNNWTNFLFPYDLFFLLVWVSVYLGTVFATFKANKEGIFSFFGYLFMGSLMLLLITSYLATFTQWFLTEIFYNVFDDITFSLPVFTFYMENLGIINFIWWLSLVLISAIDKRFISRTGEVEE